MFKSACVGNGCVDVVMEKISEGDVFVVIDLRKNRKKDPAMSRRTMTQKIKIDFFLIIFLWLSRTYRNDTTVGGLGYRYLRRIPFLGRGIAV